MDLNFKKHICAFLALVCMMLSAASCIYDDVPDGGEEGALLFNVLAEPSTKLSYSGVHTSFENEEEIGCVIARKDGDSYGFMSVVKWAYQDGVLMLQTEDEFISRHTYPDMADKGYVSLKEDMEYAFFFYYPYVEDHEPTAEDWESHYLSVALDYRSDAKLNLNGSDHLWVSYSDDRSRIEDGKFYEVPLTFQKKTATVEVHYDHNSDYTVDQVWIDAVSGSAGIMTGMDFDLRTGTYDAVTPYDGLIYPGLILEDEESIHADGYRMLFVPQTITSWHLHVVVTQDGVSTPYELVLEDKLQTLQEGKLYIFHIAKASNGSIMITDWTADNTDELFGEEIPIPSDLTMWSDRPMDNGQVVIKEGETLYIKGKGFWTEDHCIVDYIQLPGAKVTSFEISENDPEGFRTISFPLPASATDGQVYLAMALGHIKESPGYISTVKPTVTSLSIESYDMNGYDPENPSELTVSGVDLDLVEKVVFGGDYSSPVISSSDSEITVQIPSYAHSGNLFLKLRNGMTIDTGHFFTVQNARDEVKVTEVSGVFKAGATIIVKGELLKRVSAITLTGKDGGLYGLLSWNVSDDGSMLTFVFPEDVKDGTIRFIKNIDVTSFYEHPYTTAVPEHLSVMRDDDYFYVYGANLDVVKIMNVAFESGNIQLLDGIYNAHSNILMFDISAKLPHGMTEIPSSGKVTLTTKHDSEVEVDYKFMPEISLIEGIFKRNEHVVVSGRYLDEVASIKVLDMHRENPEDKENESEPVFAYDDGQITFTFPDKAVYEGEATLEFYNEDGELIITYVTLRPSNVRVSSDETNIIISGYNLDIVRHVAFNGGSEVGFEFDDPAYRDRIIVPLSSFAGEISSVTLTTRHGFTLTVNV